MEFWTTSKTSDFVSFRKFSFSTTQFSLPLYIIHGGELILESHFQYFSWCVRQLLEFSRQGTGDSPLDLSQRSFCFTLKT